MNTINYVIIEVDNDYINEKEVGGSKVIVNTSIETVENINRVGVVVKAPDFVSLEEGDRIIIHHNICRLRNGIKGEKVQSNFWIEGNKYFVPLTEIFMFDKGNGWEAFTPFCFVRPIKDESKQINSILIPTSFREDNHKGRVNHRGIMVYPNQDLIDQGINKGDEIVFSNYSEYEFEIDGETYYKMSTNDILGKL